MRTRTRMTMQCSSLQLLALICLSLGPCQGVQLQFSHFPLLTDRSDVLPLAPSDRDTLARPTGRPGLVGLEEREELLALLASEDDMEDEEEEEEERGRQRQRQKMSRMMDSVGEGSTVRISRSKFQPSGFRSRPRLDGEERVQRTSPRRLKHRLQSIAEISDNDVDSIEKAADNDIKDTVTDFKVRARSREGALKRRKSVKKHPMRGHSLSPVKENVLKKSLLALGERRFRVRPAVDREEETEMTRSDSANTIQRRLRPRKKVHHQEVVATKQNAAKSVNLSRFRAAAAGDIRSKSPLLPSSKQTAHKNAAPRPQIAPRLQQTETP